MMSLESVITVRVATDNDVDNILKVSEGIYEGEDYLPVVLEKWLNHKRKLIFLAEYEGVVIGLLVAQIACNQQSYVSRALRIHPKYRGRRLSYQVIDAVLKRIQNEFPSVSKNRCVCVKHSAAFNVYKNKGFASIANFTIHAIRKIPFNALKEKLAESSACGFAHLGVKDALELYKSEQLLDLIGPQKFLLDSKSFPYKLTVDAPYLVKKVGQVLVDVSLDNFHKGVFPKSFSQGVLTKRVEVEVWMCQIHANNAELFRKHFLCQLNAAVHRVEKEMFTVFCHCPKFDGLNGIKNEVGRMKLNCEIKSEVFVLMELSNL